MSRLHLDLDDLKSRINPFYADTPGTESFERRLCVETIEQLGSAITALRTERNELMGALIAIMEEPQPLGIERAAYQAANAVLIKYLDTTDNAEEWAARRAML